MPLKVVAPPAARRAMVRAATQVDRWQAPILLLAAPFFLFPSPARTPALLVLPLLWLAAWLSGRPLLPRTPLNAPLLLLSVIVLVSLGVTFDIAFSLSHITGVLLGIAVFIAVVRAVGTQAALWRAVLLFLLAGGGLVLLGLVGINWLDKVPLLTRITSQLPAIVRGLPGAEEGFSANSVAGALVLVFPLQVVLLAASLAARQPGAQAGAATPPVPLWAQIGLLALTGGLLLLAQSRSSWVGAAAGLALPLVAWGGRRGRWLAVAAVVAVVTVAIITLAADVPPVTSPEPAPLSPGFGDRREIWTRALYVIRDFPLTGLGLNAFRTVMPLLYPMHRTSPEFNFAHAHNLLLQVAVDLGLPGLAAYLGLWWGAAVALFAAHRAAADTGLRALTQGLAAGLAAHFVFGLTDAISLGAKLGIFFWFALALSAAAYRVAAAERQAAVERQAAAEGQAGLKARAAAA